MIRGEKLNNISFVYNTCVRLTTKKDFVIIFVWLCSEEDEREQFDELVSLSMSIRWKRSNVGDID